MQIKGRDEGNADIWDSGDVFQDAVGHLEPGILGLLKIRTSLARRGETGEEGHCKIAVR